MNENTNAVLDRAPEAGDTQARLARLGFLADFISRTVLVGFLTGVGIQVALSQIAGATHQVGEGQIIRLPGGVPHGVQAEQRFKMLLVMVRSDTA